MLSGPEFVAQSGKTEKLVILLHGLGADGNDLFSLAPEFAQMLPNTTFVSPNAPFPCDMAPFGYQWFSLLDPTPDNILTGVKEAAPILNEFIDEKLAEHNLKDRDIALLGFSQGTMMALYVALRRENAIAGILGYSGALVAPESLVNEIISKPPICLVHGDMDNVVPYEMMSMAEKSLLENGIKLTTHTRLGLEHGIDYEGINIGKEFLTKCLG